MATEQPSDALRQLRRVALLRDYNGLSDGHLLDGHLLDCFATDRDHAAFEALVRRHGPMVLAVCRRVLGNVHDAEDAFQATFLVLVRRAASIRQGELLGNWLYGVAYRTALDARAALRRRWTREKRLGAIPEPAALAPPGACTELGPLLDRELNCLPEIYRTAVVLCDLEGRTRRDVARQLGVPTGTLSGRLTVAREMLAKRLARRGFVLSGVALTTALAHDAPSASVPPSLVAATISTAAAGQAAGAILHQAGRFLDRRVKAMLGMKLAAATAGIVAVGIIAWTKAPQPHAANEKSVANETSAAVEHMRPPKVLNLKSRGRRVLWSPDAKTLLVVTIDETPLGKNGSAIKLWDVAKGQVKGTLVESKLPGLVYQHAVFSPDGRYIAATVTEEVVLPNVRQILNVVKIWDATTLALKHTFTEHDCEFLHVALSAGGKHLAACCDPTKNVVRLWNVDTGAAAWAFDTGEAQPWLAAFSPDGKTLVVGAHKRNASAEVTVWDLQTGKLKQKLQDTDFGTVMALSPDGKVIAGRDEFVRLWSLEKGKPIVTLKGNARFPRAVAFAPSSKALAVGGADGKVRLWDVESGRLIDTLQGHTAEIYSLAFSPDGKTLASVSQDEMLRLWPIKR